VFAVVVLLLLLLRMEIHADMMKREGAAMRR
jgi:hypothetical protein